METVAAILRNTGAGWFIINDQYHAPINAVSLTQTPTGVWVNYGRMFTKAHTFSVTPDEKFCEMRLTAGASVNLDRAFIQMYHPDTSGPLNPATVQAQYGNWWVYGLFI